MVQVYADDVLVYAPNLDGYDLMELKATRSLEKAGTATIKLPPDHPAFNIFVSFRTVVTIYRDDRLIFRGRALYPEDDFYNCRTITCEGERCFLRDAVLQPYIYQDTPAAIFADIINHYNAQVDGFKQFVVGEITATDPNNYVRLESESPEQVADVIDALVKRVGGYITFTTNDAGRRVINWYGDLDRRSGQVIEFGENLLDFARSGANSDPATVLWPYGAKDDTTGEYVTISSVNGGVPYIMDEEAVALRGLIAQIVFWDDVTVPANLLTKARQHLATSKLLITTLDLSAVDLSVLDKDIDTFDVGDQVQVVSRPHYVDELFLLQDREYNLLDDGQDHVTLGKSLATLTGADVIGDKNAQEQLRRMRKNLVLDFDSQLHNTAAALREEYTQKIDGMEADLSADVAEQLEAAKASLTKDYETQLADTKAALEKDIADAVTEAEENLQATIDEKIEAVENDIRDDIDTQLRDMQDRIEQDFTSDMELVEQTLRDEYGDLVAGILDGTTPAGGVKTVSATVDAEGYHLTSEGSVDFQTDDFNIKNADGRNLMRVTAEDPTTGEPGGQIELGEDGYPVRFAPSFVLPPENGGTGYDHGQTHRLTTVPDDSFGEDGDLAVYYNGAVDYYGDITPTLGAASTGALFGLTRVWNNQGAVSGYGQMGNSAAGNYGLWWTIKTPDDIKLAALTLVAKMGKYVNGAWHGWNVTAPITVGLYTATNSTTPLAKTTLVPAVNPTEVAVALTPSAELAAGTTYYVAMYDAATTNTKSLTQVDLSSAVVPGSEGGAAEDLYLKSNGTWIKASKPQKTIQSGTVTASSAGVAVTFDEAFAEVPHITVAYASEGGAFSGESGVLKIYNKTQYGFSIQIAGSYGSQDVDWIAVGN